MRHAKAFRIEETPVFDKATHATTLSQTRIFKTVDGALASNCKPGLELYPSAKSQSGGLF